jgi:hypothetical protein
MSNAVSIAQSGANNVTFRNRIINGNMMIDQRNAGASITINNGAYYSLDRWQAYSSAVSKFSVQQNAGSVTPPTGFTNYLGITSLSSYAVGATDEFLIRQVIEGYNIADLGFGAAGASTVTLSFWVRSSLTGSFGGALTNSSTSRSYPFSYTISAANTWEQKTITIAGDVTGTWNKTNGAGVYVMFGLGVGSTYGSGTAGAWVGSAVDVPTGATSVVGTNGATFYITGVQLEKGSTATPFENRPYGTELALCQRYYEVIGGLYGAGYGAASAGVAQIINFSVSKRAAPTMATLTLPNYGTNCSGFATAFPSTNGFAFYVVATALGAISYGAATQAVVSATSEL